MPKAKIWWLLGLLALSTISCRPKISSPEPQAQAAEQAKPSPRVSGCLPVDTSGKTPSEGKPPSNVWGTVVAPVKSFFQAFGFFQPAALHIALACQVPMCNAQNLCENLNAAMDATANVPHSKVILYRLGHDYVSTERVMTYSPEANLARRDLEQQKAAFLQEADAWLKSAKLSTPDGRNLIVEAWLKLAQELKNSGDKTAQKELILLGNLQEEEHNLSFTCIDESIGRRFIEQLKRSKRLEGQPFRGIGLTVANFSVSLTHPLPLASCNQAVLAQNPISNIGRYVPPIWEQIANIGGADHFTWLSEAIHPEMFRR